MAELERFTEVDEHVLRSSKPQSPEHLDFLKSRDIGGIISIEPLEDNIAAEAKRRGMRIIELPLSTDAPPTSHELLRAARFIRANAEAGQKTLIHCEQGRQRTSNLVLAYLVAKGETPLLAWINHDFGAHQDLKDYYQQNSARLRRAYKRGMQRKVRHR